MSRQTQSSDSSQTDTRRETEVASQPSRAERRRRRREKLAWWMKLFLQPILMVAAVVSLVAGVGIAQRFGWFTSNDEVTNQVTEEGEDVLYICPMVCVPPSTEPGTCPVCGMKLKAQKASGDAKDKYGLRLDPASIRIANIRTVSAQSKPLVQEIKAIGEIRYDEGSLATLSAYVDGRIEELYADYTGVSVAKGDKLALLYSPDLYTSQVALLEARKLFREGEKANQRIVDANRRLYESSRQRLIELGMTESQVDDLERDGEADSRIRIESPISGTVIEKLAVEGQYVKTGEVIYRVADLSRVWLMLELFPRDAARIGFGQKVVTRIQSLPGEEFTGRVAFIDPTVDPQTQTVSVRVVIPNPAGRIRIGDFATGTIAASIPYTADGKQAVYDPELAGKWISPRHPHIIRDEPGPCPECGMDLVATSEYGFVSAPLAPPDSVVVPRDAVLMAGDQSVVYVETESGRFEFRNVELGHVVGDEVSIVSGVQPGEQVVASATMLVDSQFNMAGKPSLIDPVHASPREPEVIDPFDSPEVIAALAELSESEQGEVRNQKTCPVANMVLGSMGTPIPVEIEGRRVWICCAGCESRLRDDPAKYFSMLDSATEQPTTESTGNLAELPPIQSLGSGELPEIQPLSPGELPEIQPLDSDRLTPMALPNREPPAAAAPASSEESGDTAALEKALSALPASDQPLARQQKICPVAELPLGSMGTPIKVNVEGRTVFICCEGCRERLLREPSRYLAKLPGGEPQR